jgi:hypothetical protein
VLLNGSGYSVGRAFASCCAVVDSSPPCVILARL